MVSTLGSKAVLESYNLGSKSNVSRIMNALRDRELIDIGKDGVFIEDPVFRMWFMRASA